MTERPRDRLGRPLQPGAVGFPGVPPRERVDSATAAAETLHYLAQGLPFHAHEVLEQRWRSCAEEDRLLWQALSQAAAALTHAARGNQVGAERLAERASGNLASYATTRPVPDDAAALLGPLGLAPGSTPSSRTVPRSGC